MPKLNPPPEPAERAEPTELSLEARVELLEAQVESLIEELCRERRERLRLMLRMGLVRPVPLPPAGIRMH